MYLIVAIYLRLSHEHDYQGHYFVLNTCQIDSQLAFNFFKEMENFKSVLETIVSCSNNNNKKTLQETPNLSTC